MSRIIASTAIEGGMKKNPLSVSPVDEKHIDRGEVIRSFP
jgi:hypothetical protein